MAENTTDSIKHATKLGTNAAKQGSKRPTSAQLKEKYKNWTQKECDAYHQAYDFKCPDIIAVAKNHAARTARLAHKRLKIDRLKILHPEYSEEACKIWYKSFDEKVKAMGEKNYWLTSATKRGKTAKDQGHKQVSFEEFKKDYPQEFAKDCFEAYKKQLDSRSDSLAVIKRAALSGCRAASKNFQKPTITQLKSRNPIYSDEACHAYLEAFEKETNKYLECPSSKTTDDLSSELSLYLSDSRSEVGDSSSKDLDDQEFRNEQQRRELLINFRTRIRSITEELKVMNDTYQDPDLSKGVKRLKSAAKHIKRLYN